MHETVCVLLYVHCWLPAGFPSAKERSGLWSPAATEAAVWGSSVSEPQDTPTVYTGGYHMASLSLWHTHTLITETSVRVWRQVAALDSLLYVSDYSIWYNLSGRVKKKPHQDTQMFILFLQFSCCAVCNSMQREGVTVFHRLTNQRDRQQQRCRCRPTLTEKSGVLWLA